MADRNDDLNARIARLEKKVVELEKKMERTLASKGEKRPPGSKTVKKSHQTEKKEKSKWILENFSAGEQWLNRIGIGLLLIGVAFLFKYSIDQGWLIPPVRSAIGLGIGLALFISGHRMRAESSPMKQILQGGSIAVFYITGFATFQFYSFMPATVIWIFMIVVTLLALSLSLQQDDAVLSVIGTIGALGTPFMLYSGSDNLLMLMLYTALVLFAAAIIYMRKGWKTLLWCMMAGGFTVMVVGVVNTSFVDDSVASTDQWVLQSGVLVWVLVSWIAPAVREILTSKNPEKWPDPAMQLNDGNRNENFVYRTGSSVHLAVFLVPLFLLSLMAGIWELSMDGAGITSLSIAGAGSLFYLPLKKVNLPKLASTHILLGLVMFTIGFVLIFEGNFLFVILAAETVALRYITWQTGDAKVSVSSHILFGIVVIWLLNILPYSNSQSPLLNIESLTQLAFIGAGGLLLPMWLRRSNTKQIYQVTTHIVFLIWLYGILSVLDNGQAWVTVAWGVYAIVLLVLGSIRFGKQMRLVGMATIFLVVGKLFLVDLSQLQAIWRILLFTGFGAVFLLLGYYWQSRWSNEESNTNLSNP